MKTQWNNVLRWITNRRPISHHKAQAPFRYAPYLFNPKRPIFTRLLNQAMLSDPHIKYGLYLIKGPIISRSRFIVRCDDEELRQFIINQLTRFWRTSAGLALESMDYGWYGCEIMYRYHENKLQFDHLDPAEPLIVRPYIDRGVFTGIALKSDPPSNLPDTQIFLKPPKAWWGVHSRKKHRWWGESRLYGAHIPWYEYNGVNGFRDSRRLFYYKNAFTSGILRYPYGSHTTIEGKERDNVDLANEMLERIRNGSGIALPVSEDPSKNWEWESATTVGLSEDFHQYGQDLREEELEGIGVPPEVARAEGTGAYAGRQVPFEAFYAMLEEITHELITDFIDMVLDPLIRMAWGRQPHDYQIEAMSISTEEQSSEKMNWALANQDKLDPATHGTSQDAGLLAHTTTTPRLPTTHKLPHHYLAYHLCAGEALSHPEFDRPRVLYICNFDRAA